MSSPCQPATLAELAEAVRSAPRVIAVGAGTKPRLAQIAGSCMRISTAKLTGFIEYEPSEFTFTALAGTPVREIAAILAERGQYLPFDPMLGEAGATLGGTVAAGVNGPGRWRYGGLRDFILGVRFVDGAGRVLRMGGKVVKNAAGFDLPKFFVGSAGRFGVLGEISFKVFPRPAATRTLRLRAADDAARVQILTAGAAARWELDAIDAALDEPAVYARLAGPEPALGGLAAEILGRFPGEELPPDEARERWRAVGEFAWAPPGGSLVKLVITPLQLPEVAAWVRVQEGARAWCSAGGNVVYVARPAGAAWPASPWPGLRLRGDGELWLGPRRSYAVQEAVKATLDPEKRFPGLEE
ncbi:MAG: FAD-binding protein [Verrucomicrobia bacterium]|nr:FAD-binding protein [Verrucomicrobiota bacterium]